MAWNNRQNYKKLLWQIHNYQCVSRSINPMSGCSRKMKIKIQKRGSHEHVSVVLQLYVRPIILAFPDPIFRHPSCIIFSTLTCVGFWRGHQLIIPHTHSQPRKKKKENGNFVEGRRKLFKNLTKCVTCDIRSVCVLVAEH